MLETAFIIVLYLLAVTTAAVTFLAAAIWLIARACGRVKPDAGDARALGVEPRPGTESVVLPVRLPTLGHAAASEEVTPRRKEERMLTCAICSFPTYLDDVVVRLKDCRCVCLRCFARETGGTLRMPAELRRDLEASLAEHHIG